MGGVIWFLVNRRFRFLCNFRTKEEPVPVFWDKINYRLRVFQEHDRTGTIHERTGNGGLERLPCATTSGAPAARSRDVGFPNATYRFLSRSGFSPVVLRLRVSNAVSLHIQGHRAVRIYSWELLCVFHMRQEHRCSDDPQLLL